MVVLMIVEISDSLPPWPSLRGKEVASIYCEAKKLVSEFQTPIIFDGKCASIYKYDIIHGLYIISIEVYYLENYSENGPMFDVLGEKKFFNALYIDSEVNQYEFRRFFHEKYGENFLIDWIF